MDVYAIISSPQFGATMRGMSFIALFLGLAFVIVAFSYYGRTRDVYGDSAEKQRWTLLLGTWRDSLLITILYSAEALIYRFLEFQGLSQATQFPALILYAPVAQPVLSMAVHVLIFTIAILRVILISKWLATQRDSI